MQVARAQSREQALNAAALQLLTGATDSMHLLEIRELIAPIACDMNEPTWIRDAITTALELLEQADKGETDADGARRRVSALLELVSTSAPDEAAEATSFVSCAMPIESIRELLPQFVAESFDSLAQAEHALLELEANPTCKDSVNVVFRAFHTIKSTSAFFGFDAVSTLAHDIESLLCPVRDGEADFTRSTADLSLACADMMRVLLGGVDDLLAGKQLEPPPGYFPLLRQVREAAQEPAAHSAQPVAAPAPVVTTPSAERASAHAPDSWVRVHTERLDELLDLVGEMVVAHSMIVEDDAIRDARHGPLARKVQQTSKIMRELQSLSMSLRMVPLRPLFQKMQRLVRDLAHSAGKPVQLLMDGEETEIDRNMVEVLSDPLVHMIRNAIDHGIETEAERVAAGKPAMGTLSLSASHAGGSVIVELRDDGRGLDSARIVASAVEKGIIENGRGLSPAEIHELIFEPGLSTCTDLTELSGRGVGMDVVRRNIETLHGRVEIASSKGAGTTFTIRVPLTLALTDGMLVRAGGERYIVPTAEIHTSFRPQRESLLRAGSGGELVMLHGHALPIVRLHHVLGIDNAVTDPTCGLLVVLGENDRRYALLVDELLGQQQVVAKPVAAATAHVPGVAGGAILGDGRVGLIIDPAGLLISARRQPPWGAQNGFVPSGT